MVSKEEQLAKMRDFRPGERGRNRKQIALMKRCGIDVPVIKRLTVPNKILPLERFA